MNRPALDLLFQVPGEDDAVARAADGEQLFAIFQQLDLFPETLQFAGQLADPAGNLKPLVARQFGTQQSGLVRRQFLEGAVPSSAGLLEGDVQIVAGQADEFLTRDHLLPVFDENLFDDSVHGGEDVLAHDRLELAVALEFQLPRHEHRHHGQQ